MSSFEHVLTDRLDLRRPDPAGDLDDLFVIFSDPAGWWYDPDGRHTEPEQSRDWLARVAWVAPHNTPSRKVAERLGLTNRGLGVDPSDGERRLAYANRALGDLLRAAEPGC